MLMLVVALILLAIWFYVGYVVMTINADGILSKMTRNRHKKVLIPCHVLLVFLLVLYFALIGFPWFVWKSERITTIVLLLFPCVIIDFLVLFLGHRKGVEKIQARNIVGTILGIVPVVCALLFFVLSPVLDVKEEFRENRQEYETYLGQSMGEPVIAFTWTNDEYAEEILQRLRERLEYKDSDVNDYAEEYPHYAILGVCKGQSPLRYEMLKVLIEHGADVNVSLEADYGITPIMALCSIEEEVFEEESVCCLTVSQCISLLLENGADPCEKNSDGGTALDMLELSMQYCKFADMNEEYRQKCLVELEKTHSLLKQNMETK